ncbi:hypothetical protein [Bdellovibrio sp. HCB337]|uniref:hypothetical protein n=1 Tax=Bdellovibrio sp. HCB337 TaxID=3394358 RepID=UPI0039A6B0C0
MSYEFYKILHITGLILLFFGLSSALTLKMAGATFTGSVKKMAFLTHGVGLLFLLVSGFGLLAKLGIMAEMPGWAWTKLGVWLVMGGAIALAKRKGQLGWPIMVLFVGLGIFAAWLAISKPF